MTIDDALTKSHGHGNRIIGRQVLVGGFVFSTGQHRAVLNAVRSCEGVQHVIDEIEVIDT